MNGIRTKTRSTRQSTGYRSRKWRPSFYDENALMIPDPDHSDIGEERFIMLGFSAAARLLVVCHCYRGADNVIRIISARKATAQETRQYNGTEV